MDFNENELIEEKQFTCPQCGSHYFGSSSCSDGRLERDCHGFNCYFSFSSKDDNKYFKGTGRFYPKYQTAVCIK